MNGMNLNKLIGGLVGAAFALRALDSRKAWYARIGYGIVGWDLLSGAFNGGPLTEQPGGIGSGNLGRAALPNSPTGKLAFQSRQARDIDERVSFVHEQMIQGTKDPSVYQRARAILTKKRPDGSWAVPAKNAWAEIEALFDDVKKNVRYTWDPISYDAFQTPRKTLELMSGDCVPATSLVVTAGYKLRPIGEVQEGELVMGDGQWTKVTRFWDKGEKRVLSFKLNNGCVLRCTPDHKLFVVRRKRPGRGGTGTRDDVVEVPARSVRVGDDLLTPETLPAGREQIDFEKAWLLGVFIADGWSEETRCAVAGKDGHPKEAQKRRVEAFCRDRGVETRWHERYISINDKELTAWLSAAGRGALNKHVPSLDLDEVAISGILKGLEADASVSKNGTIVYSTVSQELALQIRLMFRMRGQSCHIKKVEKHGGLGENPIFRVTVRGVKNRKPHARVEGIEEGGSERVVDIETDTHRFYLPESDVVVHNCDDHVALLGAMLRSVGYQVRSRIIQTKNTGDWEHIYLLVDVPGEGWRPLDSTVDYPAGWEVPSHLIVKKRDYKVVEK